MEISANSINSILNWFNFSEEENNKLRSLLQSKDERVMSALGNFINTKNAENLKRDFTTILGNRGDNFSSPNQDRYQEPSEIHLKRKSDSHKSLVGNTFVAGYQNQVKTMINTNSSFKKFDFSEFESELKNNNLSQKCRSKIRSISKTMTYNDFLEIKFNLGLEKANLKNFVFKIKMMFMELFPIEKFSKGKNFLKSFKIFILILCKIITYFLFFSLFLIR